MAVIEAIVSTASRNRASRRHLDRRAADNSLERWVRRSRQATSAIVGVGFACLLVGRGIQPVIRSAPVVGADARFYYAAAGAISRGMPLAAINGWLYPPPLAVALAPFARLPFPVFAPFWCAAMMLCAFGLAWVLRAWLPLPLALTAVFAFPPTWQGLYLGQLNSLVGWLSALALVAWQGRQHAKAGVWLALGALLKVAPLAGFVVFLRDRRATWQAGAVTMGVVIVTLPFVRLSDWLASGAALQQTWDHPALLSWTAILLRVGVPHADLIAVPVLAVTLWRAARAPTTSTMAGALLVPLMVGRVVWPPSLVLAVPSLAVLWTMRPSLAIAIWLTLAVACLGSPTADAIAATALTVAWAACIGVRPSGVEC